MKDDARTPRNTSWFQFSSALTGAGGTYRNEDNLIEVKHGTYAGAVFVNNIILYVNDTVGDDIALDGRMTLGNLDGNPRTVGVAIDFGAYESDVLFANGFNP